MSPTTHRLAPAAGLAVLLATALAALAPLARAQDKTIELKLVALGAAVASAAEGAARNGAPSVEKASGGTIKYKIYPSQQLGKAFDHYDMARDGIADLTYVNPGYQPGRFPIIGAGELPFLMANAKGGSPALDAWYRKYAASRDEGRASSASPSCTIPARSIPRTKKIVVPADIKGMKIRPAHATMATWVTQLGGTNVQARGAGGARHHREGRRRRGDLPVGLGRRCSASTRSPSITWRRRSTSTTLRLA